MPYARTLLGIDECDMLKLIPNIPKTNEQIKKEYQEYLKLINKNKK